LGTPPAKPFRSACSGRNVYRGQGRKDRGDADVAQVALVPQVVDELGAQADQLPITATVAAAGMRRP
jgi:hypothetical protein